MKRSILCMLSVLSFAAAAETSLTVYRGLESVRLANPVMEVIITPGINRVMSIRRLPDGKNILWTSWRHRHYPWINYGGSKLLPAPQSAWKYPWPPKRSVDQLPGRSRLVPPDTVILSTPCSPEYGISFERRFSLHPELPWLTIAETIVNRSSMPRCWAIWEISQLPAGGVALLPYFDAGQIGAVRQLSDFGHTLHGGILYVHDPQNKAKGFYHSPFGIMGYRRNGMTLWRFSGPAGPAAHYPGDERSLTFFSGLGTFELETVSRQWLLQPGERRTVIHHWFAVPDTVSLPGLFPEIFPFDTNRFQAHANTGSGSSGT